MFWFKIISILYDFTAFYIMLYLITNWSTVAGIDEGTSSVPKDMLCTDQIHASLLASTYRGWC